MELHWLWIDSSTHFPPPWSWQGFHACVCVCLCECMNVCVWSAEWVTDDFFGWSGLLFPQQHGSGRHPFPCETMGVEILSARAHVMRADFEGNFADTVDCNRKCSMVQIFILVVPWTALFLIHLIFIFIFLYALLKCISRWWKYGKFSFPKSNSKKWQP